MVPGKNVLSSGKLPVRQDPFQDNWRTNAIFIPVFRLRDIAGIFNGVYDHITTVFGNNAIFISKFWRGKIVFYF